MTDGKEYIKKILRYDLIYNLLLGEGDESLPNVTVQIDDSTVGGTDDWDKMTEEERRFQDQTSSGDEREAAAIENRETRKRKAASRRASKFETVVGFLNENKKQKEEDRLATLKRREMDNQAKERRHLDRLAVGQEFNQLLAKLLSQPNAGQHQQSGQAGSQEPNARGQKYSHFDGRFREEEMAEENRQRSTTMYPEDDDYAGNYPLEPKDRRRMGRGLSYVQDPKGKENRRHDSRYPDEQHNATF